MSRLATGDRAHTSTPPVADGDRNLRTRRWRTAIAAVNVFFGVLLIVWPFVTLFGMLGWNKPGQQGFHHWLLDYATWTTAVYPLVYVLALGFSIRTYRRGAARRALVIATLPVLTAYPWVLILSFFIPLFPTAGH